MLNLNFLIIPFLSYHIRFNTFQHANIIFHGTAQNRTAKHNTTQLIYKVSLYIYNEIIMFYQMVYALYDRMKYMNKYVAMLCANVLMRFYAIVFRICLCLSFYLL